MVTLLAAAVGGLVGLVLGVLWGAPYRAESGSYTAAADSFAHPAFRAGVGAVVCGGLGVLFAPVVSETPLVAAVLGFGVVCIAYLGAVRDG